MLKHIARKLAIGVTLAALVSPVAFAQTGTDPEPQQGAAQAILSALGLG
jgi:hypothetical protein